MTGFLCQEGAANTKNFFSKLMVNAVVTFLPVWFGSVLIRTDAARQYRQEGNTQVMYFSTQCYNNNHNLVYTAQLHYAHAYCNSCWR